jgi:hypothetical protein
VLVLALKDTQYQILRLNNARIPQLLQRLNAINDAQQKREIKTIAEIKLTHQGDQVDAARAEVHARRDEKGVRQRRRELVRRLTRNEINADVPMCDDILANYLNAEVVMLNDAGSCWHSSRRSVERRSCQTQLSMTGSWLRRRLPLCQEGDYLSAKKATTSLPRRPRDGKNITVVTGSTNIGNTNDQPRSNIMA